MAKIEIEIDDSLYKAAIELFKGMDLGVILSEIVKQIVITYATDPEEFMRVYSGEGSAEERVRMEKRGTASILRRLKRTEEE